MRKEVQMTTEQLKEVRRKHDTTDRLLLLARSYMDRIKKEQRQEAVDVIDLLEERFNQYRGAVSTVEPDPMDALGGHARFCPKCSSAFDDGTYPEAFCVAGRTLWDKEND